MHGLDCITFSLVLAFFEPSIPTPVKSDGYSIICRAGPTSKAFSLFQKSPSLPPSTSPPHQFPNLPPWTSVLSLIPRSSLRVHASQDFASERPFLHRIPTSAHLVWPDNLNSRVPLLGVFRTERPSSTAINVQDEVASGALPTHFGSHVDVSASSLSPEHHPTRPCSPPSTSSNPAVLSLVSVYITKKSQILPPPCRGNKCTRSGLNLGTLSLKLLRGCTPSYSI
jgi:hypothetical protein